MKAIEKYMKYAEEKVKKMYCPFGFPWIARGITGPHPEPETCDGGNCEYCWNMEWTEN